MTQGMAASAARPPAVEISALCLSYGHGQPPALDHLDASFPAGELSGLVGPDASGKTTLMRVLAGLLLQTSGEAMLFGRPAAIQTGQIGYMPQHFGLYEDLTVGANLHLQARLRGLGGDEEAERSEQLLKFTGLGPFLRRLAGRLSGGMKQKLGIACALMGSPRLLLLDEPGVGVDPLSRLELWNMVQQLKDGGMTIIWATSYMDEAQRFPHILLLDEGRAMFQGSPSLLMQRAAGRVFLLPEKQAGNDAGRAHRQALLYWSAQEGLADALIQGSALRLTLLPSAAPALGETLRKDGASPASPGLEDAYMIITGGIGHAASPFVKETAAHSGRADPGTGQGSDTKILAEGLTKKFGDFVAARNISLSVRKGMIFGLLGPNGAGKSTTFQMLCGLLRPSSGHCFVDGVNLLKSSGKARSRLGYMAQKFSLYTDISVRENIRCWGKLYGMSATAIGQAIERLALELGLGDWLRMKTGELPAGLKQRLSLLCATMHDPPVLFLDEPTSGVDVKSRREFWKHISALTNDGAAVIVTTHFMEEAEYCDEIALLYRGSIIRQGSPDYLKKSAGGSDATLEAAFIQCIREYDSQHPL